MIHPSKPIAIAATAAGLALAPLAIAACGGGGATAATAPKTSSTAATTATSATPASVGTASTALGTILVDSQGRTLYLFTHDSGSTSTCTGACATAWPPLTSSGAPTASSAANASLLGTTKRADGSTQVTYAGHPLYRFVKDVSPGQTNGQGVTAFGGSWFAVTAAGDRAGHSSSSSPGSQHAASTPKAQAPKPAPQPAAEKAAPEPEAPKPAPKPAPRPVPAPKAESPAAGGIPQNGGGDGDADNNGGPSDGDGNV
jgi:predicted lipoprotein with Yx(FWY)xxD motif